MPTRLPASLSLVFLCLATAPITKLDAAELGMGFRVGEVTQTSAVVWTRITQNRHRNDDGYLERNLNAGKQKEDVPLNDRHGAMPGAAGEVRLLWTTGTDWSQAPRTGWVEVSADRDFTHQFLLKDLLPATRYHLRAEARADPQSDVTATVEGSFGTAARPDQWQDVTFGVITGQMYKDLDDSQGFLIYSSMPEQKLDFLVLTGDTVYYDNDPPLANSVELARHHWHRTYSLPRLIEFHRQVPGYWEVDDHDLLQDDCWPGMDSRKMRPLTFEMGAALLREQIPIGDGPTHRTIRWGRGLQIWLVEGRLYRSPNSMPDGPDKSIWGKAQRDWLMKSILDSDADFRILISPTPIVGPDRDKKADNHANKAFQYEGQLFRNWTREQGLDNFFVCCGDRHWQYLSIDPETGLQEFSCGPVSDQHAGGSPGRVPEIQPFHRVKGGYLTVSVAKKEQRPTVMFRHHAVNGEVVNEWSQSAE